MSEAIRSGRLSFRRRARQAFHSSAGSALLVFVALNVVFMADLLHDGPNALIRVAVHALIAMVAGVAIGLFIALVPRTWRLDDGRIVVDGPGSLRGNFRVKRIRSEALSADRHLWHFTLENGVEFEAMDLAVSESKAVEITKYLESEFGVLIH